MNVDEALRMAEHVQFDEGDCARTLAAEVRRLRAEQHEVACPSCGATIRARLADAGERERLEAGAAVVRAWDAVPLGTGPLPVAFVAALDALARAHGEGS